MAGSKSTTWAFVEQHESQDETLARARYRSEELGAEPVSTGTGPFLASLAAASGARTIVEIGTGTGVSGLWLLRGMGDEGVLTTLDVSAENGRAAAETFREAGIPRARTRMITGSAASVLPRLSSAAYDMVFIDADKEELPTYCEQAHRLLRTGGTLVVHGALWRDRVADPARRDATTVMLRGLLTRIRDDESWQSSLAPIGDGILLAVKRD